jgi:acyl carrier protein
MSAPHDIGALVRQAIEDVTLGAKPAASIADDATLLGDLELDSLDYASVVLAAEEQLGIAIAEDGVDWPALDTVAALTAFLQAEAERAA